MESALEEEFLENTVRTVFEDSLVPVVVFDVQPDVEVVIGPIIRTSETPPHASYAILPLIPGYGMTHHESQGQEFKEAVISVESIFCAGQTYTVLSRMKHYEHLHLT